MVWNNVKWQWKEHKYKVSEVWNFLRPKKDKVVWSRLIWGVYLVPKHAMVAWKAILNKLPTLDRLINWGMNVQDLCVLCVEKQESRNYIFGECIFSKAIWQEICDLRRTVGSWEQELNWVVAKLEGKVFISILLHSAWATMIYHVWREGNSRLHGKKVRNLQQVLSDIKWEVSTKLSSLRNVRRDRTNNKLVNICGIFVDIFV
ncbi:hypothetical protein PTKIN_Ptkin14bG0200800 [Pterospermum kingtungense]